MYEKMTQEEKDKILERLNLEGLPFPGYEFVWDRNHMKHMGSGGFGAVYECDSKSGYGDKMAVKVIGFQTPVIEDSKVILKYLSEVEIQKKVKCREVVRIQDASVLCIEFDDEENIRSVKPVNVRECKVGENAGLFLFILMEKLQPVMFKKGHSIDVIDQLKNPSEAEAWKFALDIGEALHAAHTCEEKFIHRDVKPENIFWDKLNQVYKLGDFGIARAVDKQTTFTEGIGTKAYMAPEVLYGRKYDVRADIYSYGMTLYRLLNNEWEKPKFYNREKEPELPLPCHGSKELCKIVLKACSYNKENRYASMRELLEELKALNESSKEVFEHHQDEVELLEEDILEEDAFKLNLTRPNNLQENENNEELKEHLRPFAEQLKNQYDIEDDTGFSDYFAEQVKNEFIDKDDPYAELMRNALGLEKKVEDKDSPKEQKEDAGTFEEMLKADANVENKLQEEESHGVVNIMNKSVDIVDKVLDVCYGYSIIISVVMFFLLLGTEFVLGPRYWLDITKWQTYVVGGLSCIVLMLKWNKFGFRQRLTYIHHILDYRILNFFYVITILFCLYYFFGVSSNWLLFLIICITFFGDTAYQCSITFAMIISCIFSKWTEISTGVGNLISMPNLPSWVEIVGSFKALFNMGELTDGLWIFVTVIIVSIAANVEFRRKRKMIHTVVSIFGILLIVMGWLIGTTEVFAGTQLGEVIIGLNPFTTGIISLLISIISRFELLGELLDFVLIMFSKLIRRIIK